MNTTRLMMAESNHNKWYQSSSDPRELLEARAETTDSDVSRTLVVTIEDVKFPVTIEVLHRVFDQFGAIEDIEIHHGKETMQALVRFQVLSHANSAKIYLDGRYIFDGCCFMHIQFLSEINSEELLDQNIAFMKITQALLDMTKEMSVEFQKIRDTLSEPRNVRKNTIAPTILLDKTSDDESVHLKEESDETWVKEGEIGPEIHVFDEMPLKKFRELRPIKVGPDMFDDMPVSGVEESEKDEINSNRFDEIPIKKLEQLKLINVGSKVFVVMLAKDLINMKKVAAIETGPKVLDEMIRIGESKDSQANIMESVEGCYLIKDEICLLCDDGIAFGGFLIEPGGFVETDIGVEHKKWGESGFTILIPWQNAMTFYTCKDKLLGNSQTDKRPKCSTCINYSNLLGASRIVVLSKVFYHWIKSIHFEKNLRKMAYQLCRRTQEKLHQKIVPALQLIGVKKLDIRGNLMCRVIWLIAQNLKSTLWKSCLQWMVIAESFTKEVTNAKNPPCVHYFAMEKWLMYLGEALPKDDNQPERRYNPNTCSREVIKSLKEIQRNDIVEIWYYFEIVILESMNVGVQACGGGLWHTWFNCGLTIAGGVIVRQQKDSSESFSHRLVRIEELAPVLDTTVKAKLNKPAAENRSTDSKSQKHPTLLLQLIPPQAGFGCQQQLVSGDARMTFLPLTKQVDVVITEAYTLAYKLILKHFELGSLRSRIF